VKIVSYAAIKTENRLSCLKRIPQLQPNLAIRVKFFNGINGAGGLAKERQII